MILKDSGLVNAGFGSNLNVQGVAEYDASLLVHNVNEATKLFGAVGAVSGKFHY